MKEKKDDGPKNYREKRLVEGFNIRGGGVGVG